jgi:hypothetical protein
MVSDMDADAQGCPVRLSQYDLASAANAISDLIRHLQMSGDELNASEKHGASFWSGGR